MPHVVIEGIFSFESIHSCFENRIIRNNNNSIIKFEDSYLNLSKDRILINTVIIKEYHIQNASAGFDHSVEKTFTILKNGNPVKNNDYWIPLFDEANPVLIDNDRREIMNCFVVIYEHDDNNSLNICPSKSDKKIHH